MDCYVEFYASEKGREPMDAFMANLTVGARAKVARAIDMLDRFGLALGPPHLKKVGDHVWELRTVFGGNSYRILLFKADGTRLVLSHGITKKSQKLDASDIELAERRRREYDRKGR